MRIFLLVLCFASVAFPAFAEDMPQSGKLDYRMRSIKYNENQVTRINGHYGFTTQIRLAEDETISDAVMGDPSAWACEVRGNHIFLKPSAPDADTNLNVLTDKKRVYVFDLKAFAADADAAKFYLVTFAYPEDERLKAEAAAREREIQEKLAEGSRAIPHNWNYWKVGHEAISPVEAFDDRNFTYLTFRHNVELPAIYKENLDGSEALINAHVQGNTIVVHGVVQKLVLRKGNLASCVINASFDPQGTRNFNYWKEGPEIILPVEAYDDERFTYLTFASDKFPAVFKVNADDSEVTPESHIEGNTLVIHEVVQKIALRKGDLSAHIVNASYSPDNESGMTVRGFRRVVK